MTTIDASLVNSAVFPDSPAKGGDGGFDGRWIKSRPGRVTALVGVIVVLSLADLYLTLLYLRTVGMGEANPLAHLILQYCSVEALAAWKILTVLLATVILLALRRVRCAEVAAWGCAIGLCVLTVHWYRYSRDVSQLTPVIHNLASLESAKWIHEPH